jgi:hypothetical protein
MKNKQGAGDFNAAAIILEEQSMDNLYAIIKYYYKSGKCYENADLYDDAEIQFLQALSLID